jgi:hypothetical protein
MNPKVRVILFAHPRSGSSSLYQILQLHPDLHILEEPFNEHFVDWNASHKNYRALIYDTASLDTQLAEMFTSYNGVKVLNYQLPEALAVHLLQRSDCQVIFLRRRNLLQAVVSVLLAEQTHLWKKWEMTQPLEAYYRHLRPLDIPDAQRRVRELKNQLDFFEAVVDARPDQAVLKLTYEDLYFAPADRRDEQITAIWKWLGIAPLESEHYQAYLRPEAAKLNSAATYAWLPNAADIQQECGNDMTGWLYE